MKRMPDSAMLHNHAPLECRLLIDPPASGAWNMAVDEMLLEWSAEHGGCCWRMYGWQEPTVSLGYFQKHTERRQHTASLPCPAVRRLTGGGAIIHDAELTYSLVVPAGHPLAKRRDSLYETIHGGLIDVLTDFAIRATLCQDPPSRKGSDEPFLCFQRRAPGDVVVGRTKIAGSAQRRRRGAVLQHGSVLLRRSQAALELDALEDVTGKTLKPEELAEAWLGRLCGSDRMVKRWRREPLSAEQHRRATSLVEMRYSTTEW